MLANRAVEQINRESMQQLQLMRLQKQVKWALEKSSFNRDRLTAAGVDRHTVQSLEDIVKLPVTSSEELGAVSPYDVMTLPINGMLRVASYHMEKTISADALGPVDANKNSTLSANITLLKGNGKGSRNGKRLLKAFTGGDIAQNMEMLTRVLQCYGLNKTSMVGIFGPGGHTGLLDVQYVLEGLGATVMLLGGDADAASSMLDELYMDMLVTDRAGLDILGNRAKAIKRVMCLCSFAELERYARNDKKVPSVLADNAILKGDAGVYVDTGSVENKDDINYSPAVCCIQTEEDVQQLIWLPYSPELGAAGIMFDCLEGDSEAGKSYHINEDLFYPEISDSGELLLTTLNAEAMPVLRFNTGVHGKLCYGRCRCGRTLTRFRC